jgi:hypothetical protein
MAAVVKTATPGFDALSAQHCIKITELFSGGAFAKFDPVYINSDGAVVAAVDTSDLLGFDGFAMSLSDSDIPTGATYGTPVTIYGQGLIMEWLEDSDDYTPGTKFYVGAANQLETTGRTPVAMAINNKEIIVISPPGVRGTTA